MGGGEVYQPPPPAASHRALCLSCPSPCPNPCPVGCVRRLERILCLRRAAGTGLPAPCRSPRRLTSAAAGAPLPPPLMVAVEPSVNMTDACYTNPADATCASFQRTDAGGCCRGAAPRCQTYLPSATAASAACRAAAAAAAVGAVHPSRPQEQPVCRHTPAAAPIPLTRHLAACHAAEWTSDLEKLCQAMPFMVGCSMWKACTVRTLRMPALVLRM